MTRKTEQVHILVCKVVIAYINIYIYMVSYKNCWQILKKINEYFSKSLWEIIHHLLCIECFYWPNTYIGIQKQNFLIEQEISSMLPQWMNIHAACLTSWFKHTDVMHVKLISYNIHKHVYLSSMKVWSTCIYNICPSQFVQIWY